jgi:hypothetical protein
VSAAGKAPPLPPSLVEFGVCLTSRTNAFLCLLSRVSRSPHHATRASDDGRLRCFSVNPATEGRGSIRMETMTHSFRLRTHLSPVDSVSRDSLVDAARVTDGSCPSSPLPLSQSTALSSSLPSSHLHLFTPPPVPSRRTSSFASHPLSFRFQFSGVAPPRHGGTRRTDLAWHSSGG